MAYIDAIPANYDDSSLTIDPAVLSDAAQSVKESVAEISLQLKLMNIVLTDLTLSWTGTSASAANKYNDEWNDALQDLFGTKGDPDSGALTTLASGVSAAAQNYNQTEDAVTQMFSKFGNAFSASSAAKTPEAPSSVFDDPQDRTDFGSGGPKGSTWIYHTTSVNEF